MGHQRWSTYTVRTKSMVPSDIFPDSQGRTCQTVGSSDIENCSQQQFLHFCSCQSTLKFCCKCRKLLALSVQVQNTAYMDDFAGVEHCLHQGFLQLWNTAYKEVFCRVELCLYGWFCRCRLPVPHGSFLQVQYTIYTGDFCSCKRQWNTLNFGVENCHDYVYVFSHVLCSREFNLYRRIGHQGVYFFERTLWESGE